MAKNILPKNRMDDLALFPQEGTNDVAPVVGAPAEGKAEPKKRGKKPDPNVQREHGSRQGLQHGFTRRTMIFKESTLQDLIQYAELNGITIKDAIDFVICSFMDDIRQHPEKMQEATKRLQDEKNKKMREFMNGGKSE